MNPDILLLQKQCIFRSAGLIMSSFENIEEADQHPHCFHAACDSIVRTEIMWLWFYYY